MFCISRRNIEIVLIAWSFHTFEAILDTLLCRRSWYLGCEKKGQVVRRENFCYNQTCAALVKRPLMMVRTNSEVHQYLFTDSRRQCSNSFEFWIFFNICSNFNANVFFGHQIRVWRIYSNIRIFEYIGHKYIFEHLCQICLYEYIRTFVRECVRV